jgi:phospholipid/cholesterol/gamma-HCH transport system substrate-binding protein
MLRRSILLLMVIVGLAAIGSLFVRNVHLLHQNLKSCFSDVQGLKKGAGVNIAGVDVGTVRSVRANPQNKNCPAEVEMALSTPYDLRVPKDAIAAIETTGLLGQSYVDIDVSQASGAPIENYGYLKSKLTRPSPSVEDQLKAADVLLRLVQAAKEAEKEVPKDDSASANPSNH